MPRRKNGLSAATTFADLIKQLGHVSPRRIRLKPLPGTATESDLIMIENRENRLFELIDGVLVEKIMGVTESSLAMWLGYLLQAFLEENDLGFLSGESGATRLMPGLVRIPDVTFFSWQRFPTREFPIEAIAGLAPDLAVEVLSKGNTRGEMRRKLQEYFLAGVRLVWFVDPRQRTVEVFTAPDESMLLVEGQSLDGGPVLPGFQLPLQSLFARVPRTTGKGKTARKSKRD